MGGTHPIDRTGCLIQDQPYQPHLFLLQGVAGAPVTCATDVGRAAFFPDQSSFITWVSLFLRVFFWGWLTEKPTMEPLYFAGVPQKRTHPKQPPPQKKKKKKNLCFSSKNPSPEGYKKGRARDPPKKKVVPLCVPFKTNPFFWGSPTKKKKTGPSPRVFFSGPPKLSRLLEALSRRVLGQGAPGDASTRHIHGSPRGGDGPQKCTALRGPIGIGEGPI